MSNQLLGSMVRGFGMTLGRKAANSITSSKPVRVSKAQLKWEAEQQKNLDTLLKIREQFLKIMQDTEISFKEGKISESEYLALKAECESGLAEGQVKINNITNQSQEPVKKTSWFVKLLSFFGWLFLISIIIALISK
jgi:hypothetical protein